MKGRMGCSRNLEERTTCKKCGRKLEDGEVALCPACSSQRASRWRKVAQVVGGAAFVILIAVTGGRFRTK